MSFILRWIVMTLAVMITAYLLPGITLDTVATAFVTALVLGFLNSFIKPLVVILTLPVNILTLGFFTLVINALLILLASVIVPGFHVSGFWWALLFGVILSIVRAILSRIEE